MKLWIAATKTCASAVLASACLNLFSPVGALADNLLNHGGFETTDPNSGFAAGWGKHWSYTGDVKVITEPAKAHSGNGCISVSQSGPNASAMFTTVGSARVSPSGTRQYKLTVWAKGHGQLAAMAYLYGGGNFLEPDNNAVTPTAWTEISSDAWRQYSFDVNVPATAVLGSSKQSMPVDEFEVLFNVKQGPVLLDDATLTPADATTPAAAAATVAVDEPPFATATPMPEPKLDGLVDPAEWAKASGTTGFFALGEKTQANRQTSVRVGFDEKNLYIAFESKQNALVIKETAGELHIPPGNDLEAFELWLKPPGKGFFQYLAVPGGGHFLRSQDNVGTWGKGIRYASKVADSGEMHGGILSLGKKLWSGEIVIPFADLGVPAPKDGEDWRMNFCRDFSVAEGVARVPQDWTTWTPLERGFGEVERFGSVQFNRKATPFTLTSLGDLTSGHLTLNGATSGKVAVQSVITLQQSPGTSVLDQTYAGTADDGLKVKEEIKANLQGTTPMNLRLTVKDASGNVLSKTQMPFVLQPSFSIDPQLIYGRGQVEVALSTSRLAQLPASPRAEVWINAADGEAVTPRKVVAVDPKKPNFNTELPIDGIKPGTYFVKAEIRGEANEAVASTAEPLTIPDRPAWLDNKLGIVDTVPPPFTPLTVDGNKVGIVLREYTMADNGLPQQVTSVGEHMLTGPITVRAVVNGKPVTWAFKPLQLNHHKPREAEWTINGTSDVLDLTGTIRLSFDGFGLWDVKFSPKAAVTVQELSIDVPVKKEHALFAKGDGNVVASIMQDRFTSAPNREDVVLLGNKVTEWGSWSYSRKGWVWPKQNFNEVYVGSDERGFSLMTETHRNVIGGKYAEFIPQAGGQTELMRINLISQPTELKEPLPYKYFFQTTPVKPEPKDPKRWHVTFDPGGIYNHVLPGYQKKEATDLLKRAFVGQAYYDLTPDGYPQTAQNMDETQKGLQYFHSLGMKVVHNLWYSAIATSLPETKIFGKEWAALPTYGWSTPNSTLTSACQNSDYQQFMIWCTDGIINKLGFDGVYTDATAVPCSNEYHGCGYVGKDGKRKTDLNMLSTRRFTERLYNILKEDGRDRLNFSHSGESTSSASFLDVRTHGEELCWEEKDHYKRLSPDYFRSKYAENEYGVPYTFYPVFYYTWRAVGKPTPTSEVMMMCLPHRVMPAIAYNPETGPIWDLFDPWWTEAKFIAYWKPNAPATTSDPINVLASTYLKREKGEALVVVSNWSYQDQQATVRLDPAKLGFAPKTVSVVDNATNAITPLSVSNLSLSIPNRDYRVLLVK